MIFRLNKRKELLRKVFHILLGLIGIANIQLELVPISILAIIYVLGVVLFIVLNTVDLGDRFKDMIFSIERHGTIGAGMLTFYTSYFALHIISVVDQDFRALASASMAILTFGDGFSAIFGITINKFKLPYNKTKNWVGFFVGSLFATIGAAIFVQPFLALIVVSATMLLESLDAEINGHKIDDNLLIPIMSFGLLYFFYFW